jgi:integrase
MKIAMTLRLKLTLLVCAAILAMLAQAAASSWELRRAADIDSHADRMCIRVEQGKGSKDRYVPLTDDVLGLLRAWWSSNRSRGTPDWLFPSAQDP